MLFACIYVPEFAIQSALRLREGGRAIAAKVPIAIVEGPAAMERVLAANLAARQAGIEVGMAAMEARAAPGALVHKRDPAQEEAARRALVDCARGFSPIVEATSPDAVIADLSGSERLLGAPQKIGRELAAQAAGLGLAAQVGLAANPDAAWAAARGFAGVTVLPPGEESARLGPLPIDVLGPRPEMLEALESWGIRTLQALAVLPPVALVERLGQEGLRLQRLARGENRRMLVPAEPEEIFCETAELEEAIELLEPLRFALNRALEQLTERLTARALATDEIAVCLGLEAHEDRQVGDFIPDVMERIAPFEGMGISRPQNARARNDNKTKSDACQESAHAYQRRLKLPVATQDHKLLLKLLQLELSAHPPGAAVKTITITALPARPRHAQAGFFLPAAPEPEKLEVLLARLRAVVGERDAAGRRRVGAAQVLDSHAPDEFAVNNFQPPSSSSREKPTQDPARGFPMLRSAQKRRGLGIPCALSLRMTMPAEEKSDAGTIKPMIALRRFRPPLATQVETGAAAPASLRLQGKRVEVIAAAGPWRGSGGWWDNKKHWEREEWDLALGSKGIYRVVMDNKTKEWLVEGIYD